MRPAPTLLLVAAALAAAALALLLWSPEGAPPSAGLTSIEQARDGDAPPARADLAQTDGSGARTDALPPTAGAPLAALGEDPSGGPRLALTILAPAGTPADEAVEVVVTTRDVGLGRLLALLDRERPSDTLDLGEALAIEMASEVEQPAVIFAAIAARGMAVRGAEGAFLAEVAVPSAVEGLFVYVLGTHLRTPEPARVAGPLADGVHAVSLTPELGGALVVTLAPGEVQAACADQKVTLRRAEDQGALGVPDSGGRGRRVRQDRRTDAEGRVLMRALPTELALELRATPDVAREIVERVAGLAPGETRRVTLTLTGGAALAGLVVDTDGTPAAGAQVHALRKGSGFGFGFDDRVVRATTADAAGRFELVGLPEGALVARAELTGRLQSESVAFEVRGESATLADGGALTLTLRAGRTIAGRATFADGRPAAGLVLSARFDPTHLVGMAAMGALTGGRGEGTTGPDGRFEVGGLGAGPFVLEAEATAADGTVWRVRRDGVRPGTLDLELVLHTALAFHGRVVDGGGAPVRGLEVSAVRRVAGAVGKVDVTRFTARSHADDGTFRIADLLAGDYELFVRATDYVTLAPLGATLPADAAQPLTLTVARTATVQGTVLAPTGAAVADARVVLARNRPEWQSALEKRGEPTFATTDGDGRFELRGVPPGEVALQPRSREWAHGAPVSLVLAEGEVHPGVTLILSNGGVLTGEAYDETGAHAVGWLVQVQLGDGDRQTNTTTGADGRFRIERLLPGTYQVVGIDLARASAKGQSATGDGMDVAGVMSALKMASATIVEGEETHVVLGAPPANPVEVAGQVTRAGQPVAGAMVSFFPVGPRLYERLKLATTADDGRYTLTLDEPGDYVVAVQRQLGDVGQQHTVEFQANVAAGGSERHDFELPGGRIAGRIVDEDGRGIAGARVSLGRADGVRTDQLFGGSSAEVRSGADGHYALDGLFPGTYRVAAGGAALFGSGGASRGRVVRTGLALADGANLEGIDLVLPLLGSVAVTVRGADGLGRAGVTVFVRDERGEPLESLSMLTTGEGGRVVVEGLAPGRYAFSARGKTEAASDGALVAVRAGETAETTLVVENGTIVRVRLEGSGESPAPSATVRVLDAAGRDVAGMTGLAELQELYLDRAYSRTEHRLGPLPPGRYTVQANGAGLRGERRVTLRGEAERVISIVLD